MMESGTWIGAINPLGVSVVCGVVWHGVCVCGMCGMCDVCGMCGVWCSVACVVCVVWWYVWCVVYEWHVVCMYMVWVGLCVLSLEPTSIASFIIF